MQQLFAILVILFANFVVLGQTDSLAPEKCPALEVTLSQSVVDIGEIVTASAIITDAKDSKTEDLKFTWFIDGGIILEGQGKPEIKVKQLPDHAGKTLTVSVKVESFLNKCPAISGSATTDTICKFPAIEIDRYKKLPFNEEKARLIRFADHLLQNNASQALIAVSFDRQTSEKYRNSKIKRIFDYLTAEHKIEPKQILFAILEEDHEETAFWDVSPANSFPYRSEEYKAIKGEDLAKLLTPPKPKSKRKKRS
jgi:hypothetical protein